MTLYRNLRLTSVAHKGASSSVEGLAGFLDPLSQLPDTLPHCFEPLPMLFQLAFSAFSKREEWNVRAWSQQIEGEEYCDIGSD